MQTQSTLASSNPVNAAPAFQFYPADFLAGEEVAQMTNQELGAYLRLLCFCWRHGSLPADPASLGRLCQETPAQMRQLLKRIGPCFSSDPALPGRLVHEGLRAELFKQELHRKANSERGQKGAARRWQPGRADRDHSSHGSHQSHTTYATHGTYSPKGGQPGAHAPKGGPLGERALPETTPAQTTSRNTPAPVNARAMLEHGSSSSSSSPQEKKTEKKLPNENLERFNPRSLSFAQVLAMMDPMDPMDQMDQMDGVAAREGGNAW